MRYIEVNIPQYKSSKACDNYAINAALRLPARRGLPALLPAHFFAVIIPQCGLAHVAGLFRGVFHDLGCALVNWAVFREHLIAAEYGGCLALRLVGKFCRRLHLSFAEDHLMGAGTPRIS